MLPNYDGVVTQKMCGHAFSHQIPIVLVIRLQSSILVGLTLLVGEERQHYTL